MEVNWEIDDGYAGKTRQQTTKIDDEELKENCDSVNEALEYIDRGIDEDFEQNISWYFSNIKEVRRKLRILINRSTQG